MQSSFRARVRSAAAFVGLAAAPLVGMGCKSAPEVVELEGAPVPAEVQAGLAGARALAQAEELAALVGSESGAAEAARERVRGGLEELGLPVEEIDSQQLLDEAQRAAAREAGEPSRIHVLARLPGLESPDAFLLVAPYAGGWGAGAPGSCEAATHGKSGAGLLLELARSLAAEPLPYAVWFAFLDERAADPDLQGPLARMRGSAQLGLALARSEEIARVRLAVFFAGLGERDLVVARDLYSQRTYRERFFRVAGRIGQGAIFPASREFESPPAGHRAFLTSGFRSVLALVGAQPPPEPADAAGAPAALETARELGPCSAESLQAVGDVTLAALADVSALLRKVDRFVQPPAPLPAASRPTETAPPEPAEPVPGPEGLPEGE